MKMFKDGLGENRTFAGCHPAVNLIFFLFTIGITMFYMSPVFLAEQQQDNPGGSALRTGGGSAAFIYYSVVQLL